MAGFPVRLPSSEPKTRPPGSFVPRPSFLAHSLARQICLAPSLVAFCLVLGEAEAGSAGKQPAEENLSLASKRRRGRGWTVRQNCLRLSHPLCSFEGSRDEQPPRFTPGFLQRFLLPRSQHEGFEIPKKYDDRIFFDRSKPDSRTHNARRSSGFPCSPLGHKTPSSCINSTDRCHKFN
jgi:hypothetical protein